MKPTRFKEENGNYWFYYSVKDIRAFILQGRSEGNNGWIITSKINNLITYRGFGTIEKPIRSLKTVVTVYNEKFGDEFNVDSIMNPKPLFNPNEVRMQIIDFSGQTVRDFDKENDYREFDYNKTFFTEKYYGDD